MKRLSQIVTTGCLLIMTFGSISGQSLDRFVIGATGGEATNASYQLEFTAGEAVTGTSESGSFILNQGFNQPSSLSNTSNQPTIEATYRLYPNPARSVVNLELDLSTASPLSLSLHDIHGRQLGETISSPGFVNSFSQQWDLSQYATGIYLIRILSPSGEAVKTLRVEKVD